MIKAVSVSVLLLSIGSASANQDNVYGKYNCVTQKLVGISDAKQGQFMPEKGESLFKLNITKRKINSELCQADLIKYIKNPHSEQSRQIHLDVKYCINTHKIDITRADKTINVYSSDGLNYSDMLGMEHFHLVKLDSERLAYKFYYGLDNSFLEKGICNSI